MAQARGNRTLMGFSERSFNRKEVLASTRFGFTIMGLLNGAVGVITDYGLGALYAESWASTVVLNSYLPISTHIDRKRLASRYQHPPVEV